LKPAVIVLDLTTPVMDGWDVLRELSGDEKTASP
jgi:CheY-like chemotaxis protein